MSLLLALDALDQAIASGQFNGYGLAPIPSDRDSLVESFVAAYVAAEQSERELTTALPAVAPRVVLAYCEREAILAVRRNSAHALRLSLLAAGIASVSAGESRDVALCLVLPWRSAHHLGLDPANEFTSAALLLPPVAAETLLAFSRRVPADQTLKCMGYREVGEAENFKYEREW